MEGATGNSKFWVWVLVIYAVIALFIMYKRKVACMAIIGGATGPRNCDTWEDIILPGLTLGLYKKSSTSNNMCGEAPQTLSNQVATCTQIGGAWRWVVTTEKPKEGDLCTDTNGNPSKLGSDLKCIEVSTGGGNGQEQQRLSSCFRRFISGGSTYICPGSFINGQCKANFSLLTCKKI